MTIARCEMCSGEILKTRSKKHQNSCRKYFLLKDGFVDKYKKGYSLAEISKEYNLYSRNIAKWLRISGIKILNTTDDKNINETYFNVIDSPEKAWILGVIASDGCVSGGKGRMLSISQSGEHGRQFLEYIRKALEVKNILRCSTTNRQDSYRFSVSSKKIVDNLAKYNIMPRKSYSYEFPEVLDPKYHKDFFRGYVDGDGCVGNFKHKDDSRRFCIQFCGTEKFIKRAVEIIPIKPGYAYKTSSSKVSWFAIWNGRHAIDFGNWIFGTDGLYKSVKYYKFLDHKQYYEKNPPEYVIYAKIRKDVQSRLEKGEKPIQISEILNIPFQTIYTWIKNGSLIYKK